MQLIVPILIATIFAAAIAKKVDIAAAFCEGARENLIAAFELCPMLILLVTVINVFTGSGAAEAVSELLKPLTAIVGFPPECTPLMLVRPISGSASLAVLDGILAAQPPESFAARTAAVMMGATETTLYTIAVCYGAAKVKPPVKVFICSFIADIAGFIFAPLVVHMFFG